MTTNPNDLIIPKVSIGLPVYNGEKFIRKALDSVLEQTFTDFELIISDNASSDSTEAICREYIARDSRIRYMRQSENRGARANFQHVLDCALGELFIWFAHDDSCHPEMLSLFVTKMDLDPNIVLYSSDITRIDDNDNIIKIDKLTNLYDGSNWHKKRKVFFEFPGSNVNFSIYGLFRTNILRSVGVPTPSSCHFYSHCEMPFLAKLSLYGKILAMPLPLKYYRFHVESCYHKELKIISRSDCWRLNSEIRISLLKIIDSSDLPIREKGFLIQTVLLSWFMAVFKKCGKLILRNILKHIS